MKNYLMRIVIAVTLLAGCMPAMADIYRCKNADGEVTFQSSPCAAKEAQVIVQQTQQPPQSAPSRNKPIAQLTVDDLVGAWRADHGGGLSEEWLFTAGWLTHRNYKGQTIRSQYSFSNGTIVVHHTPALANHYDEEMTITRWTGTEMEWRSMFGTLVKAQRK